MIKSRCGSLAHQQYNQLNCGQILRKGNTNLWFCVVASITGSPILDQSFVQTNMEQAQDQYNRYAISLISSLYNVQLIRSESTAEGHTRLMQCLKAQQKNIRGYSGVMQLQPITQLLVDKK